MMRTMTRALRLVAALLVLAASLSTTPRAQQPPLSTEGLRLRDAAAILDEVMANASTAIPNDIAREAEGIAIFPAAVKAGFIFGGMRGRGVLSGRTAGGWSPPTFLTLTGGSFGAQAGGQSTDIVLVFMNRRGLEQFVRNQFKFGADASVAAGRIGKDVQAGTDLTLVAEILSYSRVRGLFAGASINGSTVRTDLDANERFYGRRLDGPQLVLDGSSVEAPAPVAEWIQGVSRHLAR